MPLDLRTVAGLLTGRRSQSEQGSSIRQIPREGYLANPCGGSSLSRRFPSNVNSHQGSASEVFKKCSTARSVCRTQGSCRFPMTPASSRKTTSAQRPASSRGVPIPIPIKLKSRAMLLPMFGRSSSRLAADADRAFTPSTIFPSNHNFQLPTLNLFRLHMKDCHNVRQLASKGRVAARL